MTFAAGPLIAVEGLQVRFPTPAGPVDAVRDVSFDVAAGETFGIVGESGSGKSTVLRTIAGLIRPSRGRILVAGAGLERRRTKAQRRALQFVFQDPYGSLHPRQTVDRVLREPLEIHDVGDRDRAIVAIMQGVDLAPAFRFRYPAPAFGRTASARGPGPRPDPRTADPPARRADLGARRLGSGRGP